MKVGVVVFPDSESHRDVVAAFKEVTTWEVVEIWHKDDSLKGVDLLVITGGFIPGINFVAEESPSPILLKIVTFAKRGGYVWGIGNGFYALCKLGLLPGEIRSNTDGRFIGRNVYLLTDSRQAAITWNIESSTIMRIPLAHNRGAYFASQTELLDLRIGGQILLRYCDKNGNLSVDFNPDGSVENIAAICNEHKNVMGMMAHPERAVLLSSGNTGGYPIFESLQRFFRGK
ncbi:phosphoribosylformylglycinamidine synthase I [Williamwhitmania taraxaci]|uniref:Phosphoribosylformylglycinamidine synthase n=1 Tax=Williamwhitmania taraxaci TaxID=1640674 RepID=A0A1G6PST2_9BACT|nr:phosphoribosylformylglycinamidine synthase I [Williamwhitmania taraxaci]SDC82714.1 phosphoribosylformylglycinamidine synthase [Williamwhitmania taraxaci]